VISERARLVTWSYVVSDLAATSCALLAAFGLRRLATATIDPFGWMQRELAPLAWYLPLLGAILGLWLLVFYAHGLYGRRAAWTLRTEVSRIVRAVAVSGLALAFVIFAARLTWVSRPLIIAFLLIDTLLVIAGRRLVRALVLPSTTTRRVLVAGGQKEALAAAANVNAHREWGLEVVGLVSDGTWSLGPARAARTSDIPLLGSYEDIPRLVKSDVVDEVLIAPAAGRVDDLRALEPVFLQLEELGIVTRLVVNFLPQSVSEVGFDELGGIPLLTFSTAPQDELLLFVRRCADVLLAGLFLVVLSPLFLIVALAIKLTSPGPVLFRHTRCGLHGRPFTFLKFRSMREGAEALKPDLRAFNEIGGPAFKMTNDPRVTPVGRFLRRTSLDELPQLWNILRGDMSFIGPRPAVVEEVRQYEPWQRRRLSMKPGLTCLWQVSGRSELTFEEWMRLDLEYIDNWSLWLDVKIALKTIPAVLLGRGAK
jgi:exopolysaccharide biosynthesis polyprenyl glycosylphosphotransferase